MTSACRDEPAKGTRSSTLADRLLSLLERHFESTGQRLNATSLSQRIRDSGGGTSHTTVANILNGSNTNPSLRTLEELAGFFGRPVTALTEDPPSAQALSPDRIPAEHHNVPQKLTYLTQMRQRIKPAERHTLDDIAEILARDHAVHVTTSDLQQLWTDPAANPTKDIIEALARYFGVPAGYLLDDGDLAGRVEQQLAKLAQVAELQRAARDVGVLSVAARLGDLEPGQLAAVIAVVDSYARNTRGGRPS